MHRLVVRLRILLFLVGVLGRMIAVLVIEVGSTLADGHGVVMR